MKWRRAVKEWAWWAVQWAWTPFGFFMTWLVMGFVSAVLLAQLTSLDQGSALLYATFAGEIASGVIVGISANIAQTRRFLRYTMARPLAASESSELAGAGSEALDVAKRFLRTRVGSAYFEDYVLKPLSDPPAPEANPPGVPDRAGEAVLPVVAVPETYAQMAEAVTLELLERAHGESAPWPRSAEIVQRLQLAVESEKRIQGLRDGLCAAYRQVSPSYQRLVSKPPAGPVSRFLDRNQGAISLTIAGLSLLGTVLAIWFR